MLESSIEKKCKKFIEKELGGKFKKLQGQGNAGDPDRLIVLNDGLVIFCELKRRGQKPTELQHRKMAQLKRRNHWVFWTDNYDDFAMRVQGIIHRWELKQLPSKVDFLYY